MGLFSFLHPPVVDYPPLGRLTRKRGRWRGQISLEGLPVAAFSSSGPRGGPDPAALALATALISHWPALQPAVAAALYDHYVPYREAVEASKLPRDDAFPILHGQDEVWRHLHKPAVAVRHTSTVYEIVLGLRVGWDLEHTVGATIRDWSLVDFSGSIGPFEL